MEAEHGFLLSGSSPHKVFVSLTVLALSTIVSVASLPLAYQRHQLYSITLLLNWNPLGEYELGSS